MSRYKTCEPYLVVFSAALFFLFEFINMNSFNVLNDQLRAAFQVNALQISNLSAMYFYANVLFLIPAGLLLDRISTKRLLQCALFLCILSNIFFATTDHFWVAKACRFVTGMGSTLCLLSCALLTARWFEPRKAGLIMGLVVTMAMLGGMLAQQITFVVHLLGSWRYALLFVAGVGLLFLLAISAFVKDYPEHYKQTYQESLLLIHGHFFKNSWMALKNRQIWTAGLYTSFINLTVLVVGALWGKDYLMSVQGMSDTQGSLIISMVFIGLIIGCPLLGFFSDRVGRRKMPMIVGGFLNLACVLVIISFILPFHTLMLLFLLLGILSSSQILSYPLIMESCPPHIIASSESLSATLIMGGGAVFQPLFGYILDFYSKNHVYDAYAYRHAILILPIMFGIAILLAFFVRETYCQRIDRPNH